MAWPLRNVYYSQNLIFLNSSVRFYGSGEKFKYLYKYLRSPCSHNIYICMCTYYFVR